jgi:hypothetical protein
MRFAFPNKMPLSGLTTSDAADFRAAREKAFLRSILGLLIGKPRKLMAWDEVADKLKLRGMISRGVQPVPVDKVIGSVGRYRDFDDAFLPASNDLSERWRRITRAFYDEVSLPPAKLYKVGDVYFVLDGNHRISVAKELGVRFIDAEVTEAMTRVPVTENDIDADKLVLLGEYAEFLERTRLDKLRPEQSIRFSIGGAYERLTEHIAMHRYYMGLDLKRDITDDEAVIDWYENVYLPIVVAVRSQNVLADFPHRTEADLYLWVIDHQHYLKESGLAPDMTPQQAASDYAEHHKPPAPGPIARAREAMEHLVEHIRDDLTD